MFWRRKPQPTERELIAMVTAEFVRAVETVTKESAAANQRTLEYQRAMMCRVEGITEKLCSEVIRSSRTAVAMAQAQADQVASRIVADRSMADQPVEVPSTPPATDDPEDTSDLDYPSPVEAGDVGPEGLVGGPPGESVTEATP